MEQCIIHRNPNNQYTTNKQEKNYFTAQLLLHFILKKKKNTETKQGQ